MKKITFLFLTLFTLQGFGQEVSKQYDKIGKFYHGVAIVWKNGLCGVIKSSGKEIVKPEYEKIRPFGSDGISYTTKDGKIGLLTIEGKVLTPNIYESIGVFKNSYAITKMNGLVGMINKKGKVVVENEYQKITVGRYGDVRAVKDGQEVMLDIKD